MRAIAFVILCFLFGASDAANVDPRVAKNDVCGRYEVFHINGIRTSLANADAQLDKLEQVYGNAYDSHLISYGLAYNQTNGFITDAMSLFQQIIRAFPGVTFEDWVRAVWAGIYTETATFEVIKAISEILNHTYNPERLSAYSSVDLDSIEAAIMANHSPTGRTLLAPHSQGNQYANLVYDRLTAGKIEASALGIVGIAPPAATIRGGGLYVLSSNDLAINGVRTVFINTLKANIDIPPSDADFWGHDWNGIYFTHPGSIGAIVASIDMVMERLVATHPAATTPVYVEHAWLASLTWKTNCTPSKRCWKQINGVGQWVTTPYMRFHVPGTPFDVREELASQEESRQKVIETGTACLPLILARERKVRQQMPIPWNDYSTGGCWTNRESNEQAWNVYSSDGPPMISTTWDTFGARWFSAAGYTCRSPT